MEKFRKKEQRNKINRDKPNNKLLKQSLIIPTNELSSYNRDIGLGKSKNEVKQEAFLYL